MANITDLLMADNALREAQQNYIVALIILRKAELEYKRVTGNLIAIKKLRLEIMKKSIIYIVVALALIAMVVISFEKQ